MNAYTDSGIEAERANVDGLAAAYVDKVYGVGLAVYKGLQVGEQRSVIAEHAQEIVARAAGVMGDRHVGEACRAVDAFVESSVAAAGIYSQVSTLFGFGAHFFGCVKWGLGNVYLKFIAAVCHGLADIIAQNLGVGVLACSRIYNEKVLHIFPIRSSYLYM